MEPAGAPPELERAGYTWKWRTRLQLQVFARDPVCTICHRAREHGALPSRAEDSRTWQEESQMDLSCRCSCGGAMGHAWDAEEPTSLLQLVNGMTA